MTDDPVARMRAEMDQAREATKELAGNLWAFYRALLDEGFAPEQALTLTQTFLGHLANLSRESEGEA